MRNFLRALLASLLTAAAIAGAMVWIAKTSIEKYAGVIADKHVEAFKHTLSEELESFKIKLATEQAENQLRFEKSLEFRARQLSEFYWPIYIRLQKDNAVWERVLRKNDPNRLPFDLQKTLELNFILPNHDEIVRIIENKFYLSERDDELEALLLKYIRHVAVYRAMRTSSQYDDKVPLNLQEGWPDELFARFKVRLEDVQSKYNELLRKTQQQINQ